MGYAFDQERLRRFQQTHPFASRWEIEYFSLHPEKLNADGSPRTNAQLHLDASKYFPEYYSSSASTVSSDPPSSAVDQSNTSSSSLTPIVYPNAPYATMYGMSSDTAYQEALAGSAHQREVADLKAAGLNPVLGVSGSGASVFAGSSPSGIASSGNALIDIVGDLLTLGTGKRYIGTAAKSLGHSIETAVADGSLSSLWSSAKTAMKNLF